MMRKRLHGGDFSRADLHAPEDDPAGSAKEAGLRYVTDARPGIARRPKEDGFIYQRPGKNGTSRPRRVRDPETLARIKRLAIPPAWTKVWICPAENGHLQATGRDARGRKQHIKEAIEAVAKLLGNTPAICRKCYVHPEVIDAYMDGSLKEAIAEEAKERPSKDFGALKPEEIAVMALLLKRLKVE